MFLKFVVLISALITVLYGMLRLQQYFEVRNRKMWGRGTEVDRDENVPAARGQFEDTVKCPVCNSYVATNHASNCGTDNCPY